MDVIEAVDPDLAYYNSLQFPKGRDEFARLLHSYRAEHLVWPAVQGPTEWIYDNIKLSSNETSRSGNMKLTVYQRAMAEAILDPNIRQVSVLKGVQIGYSKALMAIYAYTVAYLGKSAAVAFPTKRDVARFWKDEIVPCYDKMAAFKKIMKSVERGGAQDTWYEQRFTNGAKAYFRSAFTEADIQSFTAWLAEADEIDRPGWSQGKDSAGDKIEQYRNRGVDFIDSKLYAGSTPGLRHLSRIWKQWMTSNKSKLFVRCPHCDGDEQILEWRFNGETDYGFCWDLDAEGRVESAFYRCKHNGCRIDEEDKEEMIDRGIYRATEIATQPSNLGLHAPSWLSMSPGASWKVLAQKWVAGLDDIEKKKEFVMFNAAEPWDEFTSQSFSDEGIRSLRRAYPAEVPDDVVVLVIGGDDQRNKEGTLIEQQASRELSVVGYNRFREERVIGHWIIPGEVGDPESDAAYDFFIRRAYHKRDGTPMYVQATAMDMGGNHPDETRIFTSKYPPKMLVFSIRGASPVAGKRLGTIWPMTVGTKVKGKRKLTFYTVDSQGARDKVADNFLRTEGGRGPMFPSSMPDSYFTKLLCEERTIQSNGGYWWHAKKGQRTHEEWICLAYARVAFEGLRVNRPKWRDLNLAARDLGVVDEYIDPDTGEVGYSGEDRSIAALQETTPGLIPDIVLAHMLFRRSREQGDKKIKAVAVEVVASLAPVGSAPIRPRKKRRTGGIIY